jgi:hypothetical protein
MEHDCGLPQDHFDLVFSLYGIGWTTDLHATMVRVTHYLRSGGCFIISGEHPVYSCLRWNGTQYSIAEPYFAEGPREHQSWKGVPVPTVIQRRTLSTFITEIIGAGLHIEALVETPLNPEAITDAHLDPARWYSADRARVMPTTFIVKARKSQKSTFSACVDARAGDTKAAIDSCDLGSSELNQND